MTFVATTPRHRPASHAFVVPVVRELAPQLPYGGVGSAW
jgi:hypothetical protein